MEDFYLFGAGINCEAVICYFGKKNIKGIIDSNTQLQGGNINGVEIIGIDEYIKHGENKKIYITSYYQAESIIQNLKTRKIKNYFKCPYMQTGFFRNAMDIMNKLKLFEYKKLCFVKCSPMTESIIEAISADYEQNFKIIDINYSLEENEKVFISDAVTEDEIFKLNNKFGKDNIIYIENEFKNKYRYKNNELKKFENINKGKRCFIIGNAPSLKYEDLEVLHSLHEICFGVNRIYKVFEKTNWRPTYYVAVDSEICKNDYCVIENIKSIKFIRRFFSEINWRDNNIYQFGGLSSKKIEFSKDISNGIYIGNTVIYDSLQIAYYMGFSEVYLLGVDLDLSKKINEEGRHFYKWHNNKERLHEGNLDHILKSFACAADVFKNNGIILRNLSRAGTWQEIKRDNFDNIIEKIKRESVNSVGENRI